MAIYVDMAIHSPATWSPMKKTSRKTIRPKPDKERTDTPVGFRLNAADLVRVQADLLRVKEDAGIQIKIGSYAKHALLEHGRLRRLEQALREHAANQVAEPLTNDHLRAMLEAS